MTGKITTLLSYLNQLIPNRRWFSLGVNMFAIGAMSAALTSAYATGQIILITIDAFCIGLLCGSTIMMLMLPGIFRGMAEGEQAVMRAQMEKNLIETYESFIAEHPAMRDLVKPTIVRQ